MASFLSPPEKFCSFSALRGKKGGRKTGQNLWGEQRRGLLRVPQLLALGQLLRAGIVAEVGVHYILPLWSSILLFAGERPRMPVQRI